jgi:hypothetical protein
MAHQRGSLFLVASVAAILVSATAAAEASGTARIQLPDGAVATYTNVQIRISDKAMWLTSSDGKGTIVISKAACSAVGKLVRCLPYTLTLEQSGTTRPIVMETGTVWFNPSDARQPLPLSSLELPPQGVVLALHTKAGTFVSLHGTIDKVSK